MSQFVEAGAQVIGLTEDGEGWVDELENRLDFAVATEGDEVEAQFVRSSRFLAPLN